MLSAREIETGRVVTGAEAVKQLSARTATLIVAVKEPEKAVRFDNREVAAMRIARR